MKTRITNRICNIILATIVLAIFSLSGSAQNMYRKVLDFDGDGKTDYAIVRNENNSMVWYIWQSTAGFKVFRWGLWSDDVPAVGDYDGDGKTDIAIARRFFDINTFSVSFSYYIFQSSSNTYVVKALSTSYTSDTTYTTMHQDYDGDGKTDLAVSKSVNNYGTILSVNFSTNNTLNTYYILPLNGGLRLGDMSGDGRADHVSYDLLNFNGGLTITNLADNSTKNVRFGVSGDQYVPADFNGDGIGDLSVWRSSDGNWYWLGSGDNVFHVAHFGQSGDIPVAGDYDGDGKTDLAIWRPNSPQSQYWVNGSSSGVKVFSFGIASDMPIQY